MATLKNTVSNETILLRSHHLFGRHSGSSNTLLINPESSRLHASIHWNGTSWILQDSSSNGTFINEQAATLGNKVILNLDDNIQFGALDADVWCLINNDCPKCLLVPIESNLKPIELEEVVFLPNEEYPEMTIYQSINNEWVCESQDGIMPLESGEKLSTLAGSWYFVNVDNFEETKKNVTKQTTKALKINANFTVSKNEEHVKLTILLEDKMIDLGERTHHYLLLILARKRMEDQQSLAEENEHGWMDKLLICQQIGLDENHLNIHIYRFRKQLIKARPITMQLMQIIERRRGEIRLGLDTINITGGFDS